MINLSERVSPITTLSRSRLYSKGNQASEDRRRCVQGQVGGAVGTRFTLARNEAAAQLGWYSSHNRFDSHWRWYNGVVVFFHVSVWGGLGGCIWGRARFWVLYGWGKEGERMAWYAEIWISAVGGITGVGRGSRLWCSH